MRLIRYLPIPAVLLAISASLSAQIIVAPAAAPSEPAPPAPENPVITITPPEPAPSSAALSKGFAPHTSDSFTTNALLGYVCDRPVFAGDLFRTIDDQLRKIAATAADDDEFQTKAATLIQNELSRRVSDIIVVTAAEATLTDGDRTNIDFYLTKQMADLKTKNGGSDAAAWKYLASIGSSPDQYRTDQRNDAVKGVYFERTLRPRITVTRPMEVDYYERNIAQYQKPAWADLYTITLPVERWLHQDGPNGQQGPLIEKPTPEQITAAEAQATAAAKRIIQAAKTPGADFADLVDRFDSRDTARNTGGRWQGGATETNLTNPKFKAFIFSLPANSIANEPLLLHDADYRNSTVVVVKVGEKRAARTVSFNEAEPEIKSTLFEQSLRDLEAKAMEQLAKNAPVERVDNRDMLAVAIDAAITRYMRK